MVQLSSEAEAVCGAALCHRRARIVSALRSGGERRDAKDGARIAAPGCGEHGPLRACGRDRVPAEQEEISESCDSHGGVGILLSEVRKAGRDRRRGGAGKKAAAGDMEVGQVSDKALGPQTRRDEQAQTQESRAVAAQICRVPGPGWRDTVRGELVVAVCGGFGEGDSWRVRFYPRCGMTSLAKSSMERRTFLWSRPPMAKFAPRYSTPARLSSSMRAMQ